MNSYLAQRDSEWMGTIYKFLGLTVDCIDLHEPGTPERRAAYHADITYGTNNEFGFDYLRDNMVHSLRVRVQRPHHFAIIDEVDSILIDEARTPLIICGPVGEEQADEYRRYNPSVRQPVPQADAHRQRAGGGGGEGSGERKTTNAAGRSCWRSSAVLPSTSGCSSSSPTIRRCRSWSTRWKATYMRDKRLHEVDEHMLFAMDEKGHNVHLSDMGLDELSPNDPRGVRRARPVRSAGRRSRRTWTCR